MARTDLALFKQHLNLDHDLDDALLTHKLDAAEEWAVAFIGRPLPEIMPASLTEGIMMLAAHWYEHREAVVFGGAGAVIPFGVTDLLRTHRTWEVTGYERS